MDETYEDIKPRIQEAIHRSLPHASQRTKILALREAERFWKGVTSKVNSAGINEASKFVKIAESDGRSAAILYESGEFANAVYHLQQAAEKATKSCGLALEIVNLESLPKDHRSPQLILNLLNQKLSRDMVAMLSGGQNKQFRGRLREVNKLVNGPLDGIRGLTREQIEGFLQVLDAMTSTLPTLEHEESKLKSIFMDCLPEYRDSINAYSMARLGLGPVYCYMLGALTFAQESTTRYPMAGCMEPADYTAGSGIVQATPEMLKKTEGMLQRVQELIELKYRQIEA